MLLTLAFSRFSSVDYIRLRYWAEMRTAHKSAGGSDLAGDVLTPNEGIELWHYLR